MARTKWLWCAIVACLLIGSGCTPRSKRAIYLDSNLRPESIGHIALLPPVDARIDKTIAVDMAVQIRDLGLDLMQARGYSIVAVEGDTPQLTDEELKDPDPEWLRSVGPAGQPFVMVLVLVDVTTKMTFGSTGNAEVAGYLYDKQSGKLVWRDTGIGRAGQGGLIGMAMIGHMDDSAIWSALEDLVASFPLKPTT